MELRLLGPLQVVVDGEEIALGGAKQRAVLATLVLRAGDVVPLERLIDEIWGDDPPQSAAHSLESYISRLRHILNGHGPTLVRRGSGYGLELGGAWLDADAFDELAGEAGEAAESGDHRATSELARRALSHWRGPALGDVALGPSGRAETERLEELRLHTQELRIDAELALGRDKQLVGELQALVAQSPYREKFVEQLMLALYRAGRQAEALDVYEKTRRRLDDDLGLQPSAELRALSGQIVRQEPELRRSRPSDQRGLLLRSTVTPRRRSRRLAGLVAAGAVIAGTMALTASGGAAQPGSGLDRLDPRGGRVALVLPRQPIGSGPGDPSVYYSDLGFRNGTLGWWVKEARTFVIGESRDQEARARKVVDGGFDLVVVVGTGPGARALAPLVRGAPSTRFAFVGARLADLDLANVPNAAGYPFADQESAQLAGYLSGLVPPRRAHGSGRVPDEISVVAPRTSETERFVAGFAKGAKRASSKVRIRVGYVTDESDRTACEAAANDQIDSGSDVVLALGGTCGSAALATVRTRGVWGIRLEDDGVQSGAHVLGTLSRYWEGAIVRPIHDAERSSFPIGKDVELGLADEYSVLFLADEEANVSESLWSKVVDLCSRIRQGSRLAAYH